MFTTLRRHLLLLLATVSKLPLDTLPGDAIHLSFDFLIVYTKLNSGNCIPFLYLSSLLTPSDAFRVALFLNLISILWMVLHHVTLTPTPLSPKHVSACITAPGQLGDAHGGAVWL